MKFVVLNPVRPLDISNLVLDIDIGNYLETQRDRSEDTTECGLNQGFCDEIESTSISVDIYYLTSGITAFLPTTLKDNA